MELVPARNLPDMPDGSRGGRGALACEAGGGDFRTGAWVESIKYPENMMQQINNLLNIFV